MAAGGSDATRLSGCFYFEATAYCHSYGIDDTSIAIAKAGYGVTVFCQSDDRLLLAHGSSLFDFLLSHGGYLVD